MKDNSRAWSVGFHYGYAEYYSKNSGGYVRCVRGGLQNQGFMRPKSESTEAQPGTVTDSSTGLMWQKKPDGKQRNWKNAKWYCEGLSLGGYSDWVVPDMDVLWDMLDKKDLFDPFELEQW